MKTLLIITSIILLSFQINRILIDKADGNLITSEVKILDDSFLTKEQLPEIDSTYRSAKSLKAIAAVAEKVNTTSVTAVNKTASVYTAKTTTLKSAFSRNFSAKKNSSFKLMHRIIKESGAFVAFTTVQFDFNKHNALDTKEFNKILQYADKLIFDNSLRVSVAGFADNKGSADYNEEISWLRANDIKEYMIELGVKEDQIILSANGIDDPVAENTSSDGRSMNRRVELALLQ